MDAYTSLLSKMNEETQNSITYLFSSLHFTQSQKLEILKNEADLIQWKEKSFISDERIEEYKRRKDGRGGDEYLKAMREYIFTLRSSETDYSSFFPKVEKKIKTKETVLDQKIVLSKCPCPVDGEKTRCCFLRTLDCVMQCGFACSYCSVQAFYNENQIKIVSNLDEKLKNLELDESVWHIGTGQASDSLLLGDDWGTLSALANFAEQHKNIIIELKSKSSRNCFNRKWPKNMIFTWSLNAPTIIEKEEHFTAPLEERIKDAIRARDNGNKVGFHIHPMFYFKEWREEYKKVVEAITSSFSPRDITMISFGTLTFTKAVLRKLREEGRESKVLEMEMEKTAGKYSYPLSVKEELFSTVYSYFPQEYKKNVFFYLCMEDPTLWPKVLKREYSSDKEFEMDMKKHYFESISN